MVMIGIDAHKKTFTAVVINEIGRDLGHKTFKSTSDGCFALVRWASQWPNRRFAVED
jgi:transposase